MPALLSVKKLPPKVADWLRDPVTMYLDYFSIDRHPFRITPDTSLFYSGGQEGRGMVLDALMFAIQNGEGILKVVGEVGSGKTMLCRMLEERLPSNTEFVYIANPKLEPDEILYVVAFELNLPVRRETSRLLVMQQLQNYLLTQHAANRRVLICIEEAQSMPYETLEEIRMFTNLETHRDKLMQIILFGQPELDKTLSVTGIRQLRERITHSFYLHPLSQQEIGDYIKFRLKAAGCPSHRLFTRSAERLIAKASLGLTRRVNILADKALLAAFSQDVLKRKKTITHKTRGIITKKHVMAAVQDSEYQLPFLHRLMSPLKVAAFGLLSAVAVFIVMSWPSSNVIASSAQYSQLVIDTVKERYLAFNSSAKTELLPIESIERESEPALEIDSVIPELESVSLLDESLTVALPVTTVPVDETPTAELPVAIEAADEAANEIEPSLQPDKLVKTSKAEAAENASQNLTRARLLATENWLGVADKSGYTVQFLSENLNNLSFAETIFGILQRTDLLNDAYLCISNEIERTYWTIKYGNFTGLSSAQAFVNDLPAVLQDFEPFVQNMDVVECNANQTIAAIFSE